MFHSYQPQNDELKELQLHKAKPIVNVCNLDITSLWVCVDDFHAVLQNAKPIEGLYLDIISLWVCIDAFLAIFFAYFAY